MASSLVRSRQAEALRHAMGPQVLNALGQQDTTDLLVNADGSIWVDRLGHEMTRIGQMTAHDAETIIRLVANYMGQTVDESHPEVSGTLPDTGERFEGLLPPLVEAPCFAVRKPPGVVFSLDDYVKDGAMTMAQATTIRRAVRDKKNILISGGTGTGKTTLANAVLAESEFVRDRVVVLEDTRELRCSSPNGVMLLTKETSPAVTMAGLLRHALRFRPDRIVVGEVRGSEALDMIRAMNTGHPGSLATVHANSAHDAMRRLEEMIGEASLNIPYRSITSAIGLVVHLERRPGGRRVGSMCRVKGYNHDEGYQTQDV